MSEQPIPMCKAALLCTYLCRDSSTEQWTLAGMYDGLVVEEYPSHSKAISWYVKLGDVRGRYEITSQIVDPDGHVLTSMPVGFITGRAPMWGAEFGGIFRNVIFKVPGKYSIQVLCGPLRSALDGAMNSFRIPGDMDFSIPKRKADLDVVVHCEFEVAPLSRLIGDPSQRRPEDVG